ncbi:endonuclease domain-containing protein [Streptomyces sp. NPDC048638]|uniref:endonuclease domain-containing protein n=1 Tax=Streptomyces sp. NPDC048638 TaxID=3365580 RepID=UPI00370FC8F9
MFIEPKRASALMTELTADSTLPLAPAELERSPRFQLHDHVLFGGVALRRYKHKGRWKYVDGEVIKAGRQLAEISVDLEDRVTVNLNYPSQARRDLMEGRGADWQGLIADSIFGQALRTRPRDCPTDQTSWKEIGPNGLPGGLEWDSLATLNEVIGGTLPLRMLRWSGHSWSVPRAYHQLMSDWERRTMEAIERFRTCEGCGAQSTRWDEWRTSTPTGYLTRCPQCSQAAFQTYNGHLDGVLYDSPRRRRVPPTDYLCSGCGVVQAAVWDHCHAHDLVRGPVCPSCNSSEGERGFSQTFVRVKQSGKHLMRCRTCRDERALPAEHRDGVVIVHLERTARHGSCQEELWVRPQKKDSHTYDLTCFKHSASWAVTVAEEDAAALVLQYVNTACADLAAERGKNTS